MAECDRYASLRPWLVARDDGDMSLIHRVVIAVFPDVDLFGVIAPTVQDPTD